MILSKALTYWQHFTLASKLRLSNSWMRMIHILGSLSFKLDKAYIQQLFAKRFLLEAQVNEVVLLEQEISLLKEIHNVNSNHILPKEDLSQPNNTELSDLSSNYYDLEALGPLNEQLAQKILVRQNTIIKLQFKIFSAQTKGALKSMRSEEDAKPAQDDNHRSQQGCVIS